MSVLCERSMLIMRLQELLFHRRFTLDFAIVHLILYNIIFHFRYYTCVGNIHV